MLMGSLGSTLWCDLNHVLPAQLTCFQKITMICAEIFMDLIKNNNNLSSNREKVNNWDVFWAAHNGLSNDTS